MHGRRGAARGPGGDGEWTLSEIPRTEPAAPPAPIRQRLAAAVLQAHSGRPPCDNNRAARTPRHPPVGQSAPRGPTGSQTPLVTAARWYQTCRLGTPAPGRTHLMRTVLTQRLPSRAAATAPPGSRRVRSPRPRGPLRRPAAHTSKPVATLPISRRRRARAVPVVRGSPEHAFNLTPRPAADHCGPRAGRRSPAGETDATDI